MCSKTIGLCDFDHEKTKSDKKWSQTKRKKSRLDVKISNFSEEYLYQRIVGEFFFFFTILGSFFTNYIIDKVCFLL